MADVDAKFVPEVLHLAPEGREAASLITASRMISGPFLKT
jgi:hypothetical protein